MENFASVIRQKLQEIQEELEKGFEGRGEKFKYRLERTRVIFEKEAILRHRALRLKLLKFLRQSKILAIVTAPVIYSLIVPIVLMDVFITVYQHTCFRVYGIPRVRRGEYVVMDRKYLQYLNLIEKMNCIYCEYANGVIAYVREVASRTEHFWCPIKHARKAKGVHDRYHEFIEYGDSEDFHGKLKAQRGKCRACEVKEGCQTTASSGDPSNP